MDASTPRASSGAPTLLSAYLGHKGIVETEYYLRLVEPAYREVSDAASASLPDFYGRGRHGKG